MGFYLCKLKDTKLEEYFGSKTMFSCADNGAFEGSRISKDLEDYANSDEGIIAVVDANGVKHFIDTLKNEKCHGRDIQMLVNVISEKYSDGFMIRG